MGNTLVNIKYCTASYARYIPPTIEKPSIYYGILQHSVLYNATIKPQPYRINYVFYNENAQVKNLYFTMV